MRSLTSIIGCVLMALWLAGCSESDTTAGIEIGNPEIHNLAFTADFSIDYSETKQATLSKSASDEEIFVVDTFRLMLTEVRSYCSFYAGMSVDLESGLILWPYEEDPSAVLPISFTDGELVEDAFEDINLRTEGRLKEIGVAFQVGMNEKPNSIYGRIRKDGKEIPFVYEMNNIQLFELRYHYSQIDIQDSTVNLSVIFRVHRFVDGLDLSKAEEGEDGVIRFSKTANAELWKSLNERFLSSFQALRYKYTDAEGKDGSAYVDDVWEKLSGALSTNLVSNGDFKHDDKDWILHTQLNGAAEKSIVREDRSNLMRVHVTKGGGYSYSVQLLHENISVVAGARYKIIFTMWSDVEGAITARLGTYIRYETNGFQEHPVIETVGKSFEYEFTPEVTDPFARLDLNLGKAERTFWIKDVQIVRIK